MDAPRHLDEGAARPGQSGGVSATARLVREQPRLPEYRDRTCESRLLTGRDRRHHGRELAAFLRGFIWRRPEMMAAAARGHDPIAALRAPEQVLRLARMGSFHQTRLSFMRVLLRHLARRNWQIERSLWEIDAKGAGVAVY